ncbi:DUF7344 domain-containing protein [Halorussus lipolyticus]|uniref:DUF7344 domain-containing protein n=1 Tax=Halorussus lipolyticus TaxID=3034024 RepID=UPI003B212CD7
MDESQTPFPWSSLAEDPDRDRTLSLLFHSLRASRRRRVIQLLADEHPPLPTRWLARQIAALENGIPPERATGEPYRNVYNALSQTHLHTLAEADIIIYDPKRQTVTPGPIFSLARLLVDINAPTVSTFYSLLDSSDTTE